MKQPRAARVTHTQPREIVVRPRVRPALTRSALGRVHRAGRFGVRINSRTSLAPTLPTIDHRITKGTLMRRESLNLACRCAFGVSITYARLNIVLSFIVSAGPVAPLRQRAGAACRPIGPIPATPGRPPRAIAPQSEYRRSA
jgi:hypothetical protein